MKPTEEQLIAWANEAGFSHYKTKDFAFDRWLGFSETLEIAFALAYESGVAAERGQWEFKMKLLCEKYSTIKKHRDDLLEARLQSILEKE
jgi:hypothetical protein